AEVGIAPNLAPPLGWYDANNGEIGDICQGNDGTITVNGVTWTVQQEWSNVAGGCVTTRNVMPPPPPQMGIVTNGNFETGTRTAWTVAAGPVSVAGGAHGGSWAARIGSTTAFTGNAT